MTRREITIVNKLGLHARAASKLVGLAGNYQATFTISHPGKAAVNGKSIMSVLMLAANKGTPLVIHCAGVDEQELADAVCALVANCFDEGE